MNKNTNKKGKDNFLKWLYKQLFDERDRKALKFIGCTLLCLTFFLTGLHLGSNDATCYTDRKQAIELVKQDKGEFTEEYNDIMEEILNNYYYNSVYELEQCQVTYELGIMTEMIIHQVDKDLLIDECNSLIGYMNEESDNLVNGYKIKQLVMEKY